MIRLFVMIIINYGMIFIKNSYNLDILVIFLCKKKNCLCFQQINVFFNILLKKKTEKGKQKQKRKCKSSRTKFRK